MASKTGTCCCVLPARRGCVVIGAVLTASHALAAVALAACAIYYHIEEQHRPADDPASLRRRPAALGTAAGLALLALVFHALLLGGARADRPPVLLAWLVFAGLAFSAQLGGLALGLVTASAVRDWPLLAVMVGLCLLQALLWHWFLVVRSRYLQLRLGETAERRGKEKTGETGADETDGKQGVTETDGKQGATETDTVQNKSPKDGEKVEKRV